MFLIPDQPDPLRVVHESSGIEIQATYKAAERSVVVELSKGGSLILRQTLEMNDVLPLEVSLDDMHGAQSASIEIFKTRIEQGEFAKG